MLVHFLKKNLHGVDSEYGAARLDACRVRKTSLRVVFLSTRANPKMETDARANPKMETDVSVRNMSRGMFTMFAVKYTVVLYQQVCGCGWCLQPRNRTELN